MFQTNELSQIVGIQPSDNEGNYKVQVQASYDSVSTNPSSTTRKIFYNISS